MNKIYQPIYRNSSNYAIKSAECSVTFGEKKTEGLKSETIPNQDLGIKELLRRHQTGQHASVRSGTYEKEQYSDFPTDLTKMDRLQLLQFQIDLNAFIGSESQTIVKHVQKSTEERRKQDQIDLEEARRAKEESDTDS